MRIVTGIAIALALTLASRPAPAASDVEAMWSALKAYDAAKAEYKKAIDKIGIKPEDVTFQEIEKLNKRKRQTLGKTIAQYLVYLERAHERLGGTRRTAAEKAQQTYDMEAMGKEREALRRKLILLYHPKCTFFKIPYNREWKPLEGGAPRLAEYMCVHEISEDYPTIDEKTKAGLLRWLLTRHESLGLDYFGKRVCKTTDFRADEKAFKIFTPRNQAMAVWFYLRSPSGGGAKLQVQLASKDDDLVEILVNGHSEGKRNKAKIRLQKGANLVVVLVRNLGGQELSLQVSVEGRDLECATKWPWG